MPWGFYGRNDELHRLQAILGRARWFFVKVTGRRRIGKTTLIQRALQGGQRVFYVQVPDSGPVGVLAAANARGPGREFVHHRRAWRRQVDGA